MQNDEFIKYNSDKMVTTDLHNKSGLNALSKYDIHIQTLTTVEPLSFPTNTIIGWKLK